MYFFDTYAIIELMEGNPDYSKFIEAQFVITKLNLIELHYHTLRKFGAEKAKIISGKYYENVIDFDETTIVEANIFRRNNSKKNVSTADCVGYIYARLNNLTFVTGDKEFENMAGVEFVK